MTPSEDIKNILVDNNIGVLGAQEGWGIFIGRKPGEHPTSQITLFDSSSRPPILPISKRGEAESDSIIEYPGIQVLVVTPIYTEAYQKAIDIQKVLFNYPTFVNDGYKYMGVYQQSGPFHLGEDDRSRNIFSINFSTIRTPV